MLKKDLSGIVTVNILKQFLHNYLQYLPTWKLNFFEALV